MHAASLFVSLHGGGRTVVDEKKETEEACGMLAASSLISPREGEPSVTDKRNKRAGVWDARRLVVDLAGGGEEQSKNRRRARCTLPCRRKKTRNEAACGMHAASLSCTSSPTLYYPVRHHFPHPISPYHPPPCQIRIRAVTRRRSGR